MTSFTPHCQEINVFPLPFRFWTAVTAYRVKGFSIYVVLSLLSSRPFACQTDRHDDGAADAASEPDAGFLDKRAGQTQQSAA